MKSLLVDALRRANNSDDEQSLSDSGSFDTSCRKFSETANDALASGPSSRDNDLALLEESSCNVDPLPDAAIDAQMLAESESVPDRDVFVASSVVAKKAASDTPPIARFAPVICLLLAVATAGSWSIYRGLQAKYAGAGLGTEQLRNAAMHEADTVHAEGPRFPFIVPQERATEHAE